MRLQATPQEAVVAQGGVGDDQGRDALAPATPSQELQDTTASPDTRHGEVRVVRRTEDRLHPYITKAEGYARMSLDRARGRGSETGVEAQDVGARAEHSGALSIEQLHAMRIEYWTKSPSVEADTDAWVACRNWQWSWCEAINHRIADLIDEKRAANRERAEVGAHCQIPPYTVPTLAE